MSVAVHVFTAGWEGHLERGRLPPPSVRLREHCRVPCEVGLGQRALGVAGGERGLRRAEVFELFQQVIFFSHLE